LQRNIAATHNGDGQQMMELLTDPAAWVAFLTLTALELVLGIDNVIFIAILVDRLPPGQRDLARRIGLALAMIMRIALLLLLSWMAGLTAPLFTVLENEFSGRDLILLGGGLFLLWKSTLEVHHAVQGAPEENGTPGASRVKSPASVIAQIALVDLVFSLDSIITAIGLVDDVEVMVAAVVVAVLLMMAFSGAVARFVAAHPTLKMLALSFLFVIGVLLIADGFGFHVPKGYVYFAMAFALAVEMLNMWARKRRLKR
jgi:predicted tellurium resistance membrane protein TerC